MSGDTAHVNARYRVSDAGDSLRFNATRVPNQATTFGPAFGRGGLRLDTLPGLFRLTATARGPGLSLDLRYDVIGDLARIPLFVPEAPAAPGESRLVIMVEGLAPGRTARFPFPQFTHPAGSRWLATPDHLPAFVALVAPSHGLPVPEMAQWSVLVVALGGTGVWLLVQLLSRRRV